MATKNPKPDSTDRSRAKDGRWQKGVSGNPAGKPVQNPARRLLMENAERLAQKAIDLALDGDTAALTACLNRVAPPLKGQTAPIQLEGMPTTDNLLEQAQRIIKAATSGEIPTDVASQLIQAIANVTKIAEVVDLEQRIQALELERKENNEASS